MEIVAPNIKFNGGRPIALCNRCFVVMCYVSYSEDESEDAKCVIIGKLGDNDGDYISTSIGKTPPSYCDKCKKLLNYQTNE